jgi:PhoPQ-activated pathogenicity-related protein
MRVLFACLCATAVASAAEPIPKPPTSLVDYVTKKDPAFEWKLKDKTESAAGVVYDIELISQKWQGILWDHALQVFVPAGVKPQATMVLWNQGGKPNAGSGAIGLLIAQKVGAPVAFLYGVPKQPLYDGKKEDALIAHTFVKYLETKDESWPLLFPMVKSVTAAMDALQPFAKKELKTDVTGFIVTGASKRGWTSWLTAASGDKRVKAIAPMVIDTLNMPVQMKNQVAAFGKPSEMIADYTRAGLVPIPDTPEAKKLWQMIDPFVYRESLTLPKMIINGTNDPYWPQDALNSYWDDLPGDKRVCYIPNAGHGLREADEKGKEELIPLRALNTLSAFCAGIIYGKKLPTLEWTWDEKTGVTSYHAEGVVRSLREWSATADTRDFRKSRWTAREVVSATTVNGAKIGIKSGFEVEPPEKGFRASFVEVEFKTDNGPLHLCTQIRIVEAKK